MKVAQSCLTVCNPMDSIPSNSLGQNTGVGSFPFSRASSQPRDQTRVSCIVGRCFTLWATREVSVGLCSLWSPWEGIHPYLFVASSDLPTICQSLACTCIAPVPCLHMAIFLSFFLFLHTIFRLCMSVLVSKFPLFIESLSCWIRVHLNDLILYLVTSVKILFTNKITF